MLIQYKVLWPAFGLHISARTPFKPLSVFLPLFGRLSQAYERLQTALVDAVVVLRAVHLYHEVSQKSSPLYPSCMIIMYMCQGQGSHEFMHRGGMHKQTNMHTHTLSLSLPLSLSLTSKHCPSSQALVISSRVPFLLFTRRLRKCHSVGCEVLLYACSLAFLSERTLVQTASKHACVGATCTSNIKHT